MKITIPYKSYKGIADSTSFTDERCGQLLDVYKLLNSRPEELLSYKNLQELVSDQSLFGGKTIGSSAIRTIFPILKKMGFVVDYTNHFNSHSLFTQDGKIFMEVYSALQTCPSSEVAIAELLKKTLCQVQRLGLINMYNSREFENHGIWLSFALLREMGEIYWKEFLYAFYLSFEKHFSISDISDIIASNRKKGIEYEYVNDEGGKIADTSYSYTHAYLLEAGIVVDQERGHSILAQGQEDFIGKFNTQYYG